MEKLSDYQAKWLTDIAGVAIDMEKAQQTAELRENLLNDLIGDEIGSSKKAIEDAQGLTLKKMEDKSGFFNSVFGSKEGKDAVLKWKASDGDLNPKTWDTRADEEIDSVNDIVGVEAPSEEARRAVIEAYERVLAIQVQMLSAFDDDGNRLFSDEDIRRELWTPLVRDNTIPENMVPTRFSEQAQAFSGAADMYQERIDDYSKNSTGHEDSFLAMGIARETVAFAGTMVAGAITIGNAMNSADLAQQIKSGKTSDGAVLSPDQLKQAKADKAALDQQSAMATFAITSLNGGLELVEDGAKEKVKGEDANWASFADKTCKVFASVVSAGVSPLSNAIIGDTTSDDGKKKVVVANIVKGSILGGISAIRMGPSLIMALKAKKKGEDLKIVSMIIEQLADVVDQAFAAAAAAEPDKRDAANLKMLGAAIRTSLIATASAPEALMYARKGDFKKAALCLGSGAIMSGASVASGFIADAMKRDVSSDEAGSSSFFEGQFQEATSSSSPEATTQDQIDKQKAAEKNRADAAEKFQKEVTAQMAQMEEKIMKDFDENSVVTVDSAAEKAALAMQKQISDQQSKQALEDIDNYFGDPKNVEDLFNDVDLQLDEYQEMYDQAVPDTQITSKGPDDVEEALKHIDRAMARTSQLRARAEMINGLTAGAAAILVAAVPGAGAVAAAQKLAQDIYMVSKAVAMHNKWVESMELAFRAYSGYGAAIEKTLENASITLSHDTIKMVLSTLKVGAEVARAADPTGISTIVSTGLSMGSALNDYGFSMYKKSEIATGWPAYKRARENPENRKAARKALRMNSTLAKCCIAYGAVIKKDPAAQEAIKQSGLSPAMLADDRDVCKRLIAYLENEMPDDPVVMHVERQPKKWQPGRPELNVTRWFEIKSAAAVAAEPRLSARSTMTPGIDAALVRLLGPALWNGNPTYSSWRQKEAAAAEDAIRRKGRAEATIKELNQFIGLLDAYKPLQANESDTHDDMSDIVDTMKALCTVNIRTADTDANWVPPQLPDEDEDELEDVQTRPRSRTV